MLSAIVAAKMGYMNIYGAFAALFAGAYIRDWATFLAARKKGKAYIAKKASLKSKFDKVSSLLHRYPNLILLIYRMLYGLTSVIVILIGISNISVKRFAIFSFISNIIWVSFYGSLSYFCAELLTENLKWVNEHKGFMIIGIALIGLGHWFFVKRKMLFSFLLNRAPEQQ